MPFKDKEKQRAHNVIYQKKHYESNKQYYIDKSSDRKKGLRKWLDEYKKQRKCHFCQESEICCLDFHHLKDKEMAVSTGVARGWSMKKIVLEIEKCVVLCANCHRKLHFGLLDL